MSDDATRVAAVLVTHDSARWLGDLIRSIAAQTRQPDDVVVVDDRSTDGTRDLLRETSWTVVTATSTATDTTTRIAQNFTQGVAQARGFDVAILGDHDDEWLPDRVAHQLAVMEKHPDAWLVASDGLIMGADTTLRDAFPITDHWARMSRGARLRYVMRHSIVTGGASAVRPAHLLDPGTKAVPVPPGWLHDRWWSLSATSCNAIVVDPHPVIRYRLSPDQRVGLTRGRQDRRIFRPRVGDVRRVWDVLRLAGSARNVRPQGH